MAKPKSVHVPLDDETVREIEEQCRRTLRYLHTASGQPNITAFVRDAVVNHLRMMQEMADEDITKSTETKQ